MELSSLACLVSFLLLPSFSFCSTTTSISSSIMYNRCLLITSHQLQNFPYTNYLAWFLECVKFFLFPIDCQINTPMYNNVHVTVVLYIFSINQTHLTLLFAELSVVGRLFNLPFVNEFASLLLLKCDRSRQGNKLLIQHDYNYRRKFSKVFSSWTTGDRYRLE